MVSSFLCIFYRTIGIDRREGLVQFTTVIEDTPSQLILGSGNHRHVELGQIAQTRKGFMPVARWIKEIDGIPAGDTVALWGHVNLDVVLRHHIGGLEHITPFVEKEGAMVKPHMRPTDKGDVMRRRGAGQPSLAPPGENPEPLTRTPWTRPPC